uniref:Uncharacterized protein n=1 Tax=Candidatus Kentrum sp. TC TaxID=2126339 RepID=A0A450ZB93_9GAMM|nr:MAG: hypothetical protein BECKTC1821D_GA0114238_11315 [Candidatus Kentron sp. TC]
MSRKPYGIFMKGFDFIIGFLQWSGEKALEIIVGKDA